MERQRVRLSSRGKPIKANEQPKAKGPNLGLSAEQPRLKIIGLQTIDLFQLKESRRFKNSPVPFAAQLRISAWITVKPVASLIT